MDDNESRLKEAVQEYLGRQARIKQPNGELESGSENIYYPWYPSDNERQKCCSYILKPSQSYPYSFMDHCRTYIHVAHLYGVGTRKLIAEVGKLK